MKLTRRAGSTSARRALVEPARRASSSSQLHRVNGVLLTHSLTHSSSLARRDLRMNLNTDMKLSSRNSNGVGYFWKQNVTFEKKVVRNKDEQTTYDSIIALCTADSVLR